MESCSEELLVLAAPAGCGKTVVAAQYANQLGRPALWVSLRGQVLNRAKLLGAIASAADRLKDSRNSDGTVSVSTGDAVLETRAAFATLRDRQTVLFLDDLSAPRGGNVVEVAGEVLADLRPLVSRVVVTTRQVPHSVSSSAPAAAFFGSHELAFSLAEASAMATQNGMASDELPMLDVLLARSGGHAALLRMMLTLEQTGIHASDGRTPGLSAQMLVSQMIEAHVPKSDRAVLEIASLLKTGEISDLESLGCESPRRSLTAIASSLPLVRIEVDGPGKRTLFEVHDLITECLIASMPNNDDWSIGVELNPVLRILALRGGWSQAGKILRLLGDDEAILEFVEAHGTEMMDEQRADDVLDLVNAVSLRSVMSRPRCLFLWSQALHEVGEVSESVAKAAASIRLAQHERDYDTLGLATSQRIQAWLDQGRAQESADSAEEVLGEFLLRMSPSVRFEMLLSYATALGVLERRSESESALLAAEEAALADPLRAASMLGCLRRVKAYLNPLWTGDYAGGVRELSPLLGDNSASFLARRSMRGNLAWMLTETGRLSRAESLLKAVFSPGHDILEASYLPIYGLILAARGDYDSALAVIGQSHAAAASYDDEADLHVNRVYQATIERAAGKTEQSLDSAERSFEGLSKRDFIGQLRLATAELGASLLALGDEAAARAWIGEDLAEWRTANGYHALCGAMVLAVADHRQGDTESAVTMLLPFATYIRSESANWRMAMYCRTFPELLGLLTAAVGTDNLPVQMTRMLLPENAERCLRECRAFLADDDWGCLGRRVLGVDQFNEYVERKGRPICRVRLFGGLDVTVDDRSVGERDWSKRKARLLFAMLVVKRGQDVPRDQILEYLWPELDEDKARNNFYVAWSTMKSALMGPDKRDSKCPYVESSRGRCRIVRQAVRSDVDEFEELIAAARTAESSGDTAGAIRALSELMGVYRGELLPGDLYDDWFSALRDKYRLVFVDAMLKAVELLLEQDDPSEAVLFARQGLHAEPHREDLYQAALRCYILAGQRSSAIETFILCKTRMSEDLGLDPSAETIALYEQVLAMEERPRYESYGLNGE
jgi:DNA-binding SARP family transcriptional activator/ATP/maltotriose-dependent transcriptional regulator MalT